MNKERMITILIMTGLFGGLIGGPIASLADYHAPSSRNIPGKWGILSLLLAGDNVSERLAS